MAANRWRSRSRVRRGRVRATVDRLSPRSMSAFGGGASMARRSTPRRSLLWLLSLCVLVGLSAPAAARAQSSAGCDNRVNDTARKLVPCITRDDLWNHMEALQAIADANPGPDGHPSRNSGEPGYKASVDYVANLMRKAGYDVTIQPYTFEYSSYVGTPSMSEVSPTGRNFTLVSDWNPGKSNGDASGAQIKPAGGIVLPPTPTSSSKSGCTAADFSGGGYTGKIAPGPSGGGNKRRQGPEP